MIESCVVPTGCVRTEKRSDDRPTNGRPISPGPLSAIHGRRAGRERNKKIGVTTDTTIENLQRAFATPNSIGFNIIDTHISRNQLTLRPTGVGPREVYLIQLAWIVMLIG